METVHFKGRFDANDLIQYFHRLGIRLDRSNAAKLVCRMDQDDSLEISYDEWRSFFMSNPAALVSVTDDPQAMLRYWCDVSVRVETTKKNVFEQRCFL
jgi:hypothetical protein